MASEPIRCNIFSPDNSAKRQMIIDILERMKAQCKEIEHKLQALFQTQCKPPEWGGYYTSELDAATKETTAGIAVEQTKPINTVNVLHGDATHHLPPDPGDNLHHEQQPIPPTGPIIRDMGVEAETFQKHLKGSIDGLVILPTSEPQQFDEMPKPLNLDRQLLAAVMDDSKTLEREVGDNTTTRVFDRGRTGRLCTAMAVLTMLSGSRNGGDSLVIHNKFGVFKGAYELLEDMPELNGHYTVHSFMVFLLVYDHSTQSYEVQMLFGIKSELNSYKLVIRTLCKLGLMDSTLLVVGMKGKRGLECDTTMCQIVDKEGLFKGLAILTKLFDSSRQKLVYIGVDYQRVTGELITLPYNAAMPVSLKVLEHEIFTLTPSKNLAPGFRFAPLGLINMYNSGSAIVDLKYKVEDGAKLSELDIGFEGESSGRVGELFLVRLEGYNEQLGNFRFDELKTMVAAMQNTETNVKFHGFTAEEAYLQQGVNGRVFVDDRVSGQGDLGSVNGSRIIQVWPEDEGNPWLCVSFYLLWNAHIASQVLGWVTVLKPKEVDASFCLFDVKEFISKVATTNTEWGFTEKSQQPSLYSITDKLEYLVEIKEWPRTSGEQYVENDVQVQVQLQVIFTLPFDSKALTSESKHEPQILEYSGVGYHMVKSDLIRQIFLQRNIEPWELLLSLEVFIPQILVSLFDPWGQGSLEEWGNVMIKKEANKRDNKSETSIEMWRFFLKLEVTLDKANSQFKVFLKFRVFCAERYSLRVFPFIRESYGATSDPNEKRTSKCKMPSSPYANDQCLARAESGFIGYLMRTHVEIDVYMFNLFEYATSMDNDVDAQAKSKLDCFFSSQLYLLDPWGQGSSLGGGIVTTQEVFGDQIVTC